MRVVAITLVLLVLLVVPGYALDFTAPTAPPDVQGLVPYQPETFGEGLWKVLRSGISLAMPEIAGTTGLCLSLIAILLLVSILKGFSQNGSKILEWGAVVMIGGVLFTQLNGLIALGEDTVRSLSEYGKLLLPVMTAAMAAQGGISASGALYVGTAAFDALLSRATTAVLIPMVYVFLALSLGSAAVGEELLDKWKSFAKWLMSWLLKISLYIFTGYMTITGAVSGTADQAAIKATRLTISGMVPVVGGILSDASESIVVGAGVMKNAAGIYGLLVILAIWITPFCKIGIPYFLLRLTAAFCQGFGIKKGSGLINDFSDAMGLLLALTGTCCIYLLISIVCFMKGMG